MEPRTDPALVTPFGVAGESAEVIKASAASQEEVKDTPPLQRRTTWALIVGAFPGLLLAAPDLARTLLPFIPEGSRDRVLALAAGLSLAAAIVFGRTSTKNSYEESGAQIRDLQKVTSILLREKEERR